MVSKHPVSAEATNILVVSDLHFGEELLPGATSERRNAVELGARAFREFLAYHAQRRLGGRPWRLVIAGDLFDFMSVFVAPSPELRARTPDERRYGLDRSAATGVIRLQRICENQRDLLGEIVRFAAAGHSLDIIVGNHDIELLLPEVVAELMRQLRLAATIGSSAGTPTGGTLTAAALDAALARIHVVPWFVYVPGVTWIEHGHHYDEGCSFQYNLCPVDPTSGVMIANADFAATRYLAMTVPELDPHGIEEWSFWGYMRYGWQLGAISFGRLWAGYARFSWALIRASLAHRSFKRSEARRRIHRERVREAAQRGGISEESAIAIDRLARTPMTIGWRRIVRMLMLDRFGIALGLIALIALLFLALPTFYALIGSGIAALGAAWANVWLGGHLVLSQLPMRAIPLRLRRHVDAPVIVFGHTHDPRWQPLRSGGIYVNSGTWLPALRPGLRRSFTHVRIQPRDGAMPLVELRQWRDGTSQPFDAKEDLGSGVTAPGIIEATDWTKAI
jgi:UDP-2,3-diacylglucosamine pyrophosphatase LpxH